MNASELMLAIKTEITKKYSSFYKAAQDAGITRQTLHAMLHRPATYSTAFKLAELFNINLTVEVK